jgi:hypothetical protein
LYLAVAGCGWVRHLDKFEFAIADQL